MGSKSTQTQGRVGGKKEIVFDTQGRHPTNNALLTDFCLSSDVEVLLKITN